MADLIDLHVHTTASDGTFTPSEIIEMAKHKNLKAIAITDHDTINGIEEALLKSAELDIEVIPGIEITAGLDPEIHILGYFSFNDYKNINSIRIVLNNIRNDRNNKIIQRLNGLGVNITYDDILEVSDKSTVTRTHIAKTLYIKGYAQNISEAFELYLAPNKPAYIDKDNLSFKDAIKAIRNANGIPVLAHPLSPKMPLLKLDELIPELVSYGLMGIEVYYPSHTVKDIEVLTAICNKYGLIQTGGSDFHGTNRNGIELGTGNGTLAVPYNLLNELKEKIFSSLKNRHGGSSSP